ncbi:unnamed protein product [Prunus armeniaca]|uniref:Uncharacterized protein n=1 Tax=Prunus armeniaca TaxID=36596 RepID=A0A6J5V9C4_PRUAR|nr:unnamed protein product [Prunus armeniaca]
MQTVETCATTTRAVIARLIREGGYHPTNAEKTRGEVTHKRGWIEWVKCGRRGGGDNETLRQAERRRATREERGQGGKAQRRSDR